VLEIVFKVILLQHDTQFISCPTLNVPFFFIINLGIILKLPKLISAVDLHITMNQCEDLYPHKSFANLLTFLHIQNEVLKKVGL
jgi:hypothetical protein